MNRLIYTVALGLLLTACAAHTNVAPSAQAGSVFRGEVWTWDEKTNVVTLRTGAENVRVQTTPDQIRRLRLHEVMTVRGELAPPADIENIAMAPRAMRAIPQGATQQVEANGTVAAVDPRGLVSVDTQAGRITVWTATTNPAQFQAGTPVRVRMVIQPVRFVPIGDASAAASAPDPAASVPTTEAGEHAVVTGRVLSVDSTGTISVESPRGPIAVLVPNTAGIAPGSAVQVRTSITRAQ